MLTERVLIVQTMRQGIWGPLILVDGVKTSSYRIHFNFESTVRNNGSGWHPQVDEPRSQKSEYFTLLLLQSGTLITYLTCLVRQIRKSCYGLCTVHVLFTIDMAYHCRGTIIRCFLSQQRHARRVRDEDEYDTTECESKEGQE